MMVDTGSSVNVLYYDAFKKLNLDPIAMTPVNTPLSGFTGDTIQPEGNIRLPVEVGTFPRVRKVDMDFVVVNLSCVHNVILGRPGISQLGAMISMPHLCIKFQTPRELGSFADTYVLLHLVDATSRQYQNKRRGRPGLIPFQKGKMRTKRNSPSQ